MKAIYKKIENVKKILNEYNTMRADADTKLDQMWVDETHINVLKKLEWIEADDKADKQEKKLRRAIRNLCKELGFVCKDKLRYDSHYGEVIDAIENQYYKAIKAFFEIGWCGLGNEYIEEDKEYTKEFEIA